MSGSVQSRFRDRRAVDLFHGFQERERITGTKFHNGTSVLLYVLLVYLLLYERIYKDNRKMIYYKKGAIGVIPAYRMRYKKSF